MIELFTYFTDKVMMSTRKGKEGRINIRRMNNDMEEETSSASSAENDYAMQTPLLSQDNANLSTILILLHLLSETLLFFW